MLIAIMGNSFSNRNEVVDEIMAKDHLYFVMDNWHLINLAFKDKASIKYIITAFFAEDEDENFEMLHNLQSSIRKIDGNQRSILTAVKNIENNLEHPSNFAGEDGDQTDED